MVGENINMQLKEVIYKRRTIRDFLDKSISEDILKKILLDGMQAPSNSHIRNWNFINVENHELRMKIVGNEGEDLIKKRDPDKILDDSGLYRSSTEGNV